MSFCSDLTKGRIECMIDYLEIFEFPATVFMMVAFVYFIMQVIGDVLTFKGKVVPEFMNVKKYLAKRKNIKKTIEHMPETIDDVKSLLDDVRQHYSEDNIAKRDDWMKQVNDRGATNERRINEISDKLDAQSEAILSLIIENKRSIIINFASHVSNTNNRFTREQFNRVFKIYGEYEDIIKNHGLVNGEVDIAYRIIVEAYEECLKTNNFIEDIRGY